MVKFYVCKIYHIQCMENRPQPHVCKIDHILKTKSRTKKIMKQGIIFRVTRIFPENLDTFEQIFFFN